MSEFGFTPSPWVHKGNGDIETLSGDAIATTNPVPCREIDRANARLIAAAPEMVETVKSNAVFFDELAEALEEAGQDNLAACARHAAKLDRALLSKIKGEEQ